MAASCKPRQRVSTLLPIAEHRQAKVCDSSFLDEATFAAAAAAPNQGKSSSGYGKKVMRPIVKLKKAFVEMLESEQRSPGNDRNGSSSENPAYWPAFSVGMGMVPVPYM